MIDYLNVKIIIMINNVKDIVIFEEKWISIVFI